MEETLHTIVLILHVIGATLIIGVAFVTFIIELKRYTSKQILEMLELIWKINGLALGLQLLTGFYLAYSEWDEVGHSSYFWIKMALFFGVGSVVGIINKRRFEKLKKNQKETGRGTTWALIGPSHFPIHCLPWRPDSRICPLIARQTLHVVCASGYR